MRDGSTDRSIRSAPLSVGGPPPDASVCLVASGREYWPLFALAAALLVAAAAALAVDYPLAQWCLADNCPGILRKLFYLVEPFGNGLGVLVIVLVIYRLDAGRRWALPRVLACAWGAGLAADAVKLLVARTRPTHFHFEGDVWATFGDWLPLAGAGTGGQSFPSAHTATAVGLAAALVWLYPAGRRLFPALALMVACQRIEGGIHYLSDTLVGAALGCLVAVTFLKPGRLTAWFGRWERRWRESSQPPRDSLTGPLPGDCPAAESSGDGGRARPWAA